MARAVETEPAAGQLAAFALRVVWGWLAEISDEEAACAAQVLDAQAIGVALGRPKVGPGIYIFLPCRRAFRLRVPVARDEQAFSCQVVERESARRYVLARESMHIP